MKKLVSLLLVLMMLVSLCACGEAKKPTYQGTFEEMDVVLEKISRIPVATMGVSMKITECAVDLLDWCEITTAGGEETALNVKFFYDHLDPALQPQFVEQIAETVNGVALLAREESRAGVLESAGFDSKRTWDEAAFALAACIDDEL